MRAMVLDRLGPLTRNPEPLRWRELADPIPGPDDVLIRVSTCGVCHTELDEIEGRAAPRKLPIILGHQVVGTVLGLGSDVSLHQVGDRVGVGWIHSSTGSADENIRPEFRATGRDIDGGYAELMVAPARYAFPIPSIFSDVEAAPLLCAGAIGYRSLLLCGLEDGQRLGLTGFGASAHLVLQLARHLLPRSSISVFARSRAQQELARELGASWVGSTTDRAPEPLDAIIDTTPAWTPVVEALANLAPGGRLVINAIRKESRDREALLDLRYEEHLWMEKEIKSVANITGRDIAVFLAKAAEAPIRPLVETYRLEDANLALRDLARGSTRAAKVLVVGEDPAGMRSNRMGE